MFLSFYPLSFLYTLCCVEMDGTIPKMWLDEFDMSLFYFIGLSWKGLALLNIWKFKHHIKIMVFSSALEGPF